MEREPMTEKERKDNQPYDIDVIPEPTHPTKATKIINKAIIVALIVIALGLGLIMKWSFQNERVLQVNNSPFPTRTIREHPTAGGVIILTADYCKIQDVDGLLRISYVSSSREIFLPIAKEQLPKGCDHTEFPILIPKEIVPDTYKIKFRAVYNVNPLKKGRVVEFESRPVEVDPTTPTGTQTHINENQ